MEDNREAAAAARSDTEAPAVAGLVGRDRELAQLMALLERCQPALVVVTGETGMRKSSLLRAFQARAVAGGWKTIPRDAEEGLSVTPDMVEDGFRSQVQAVLNMPFGESYVETTPRRGPLHPLVEQLRSRAPVLLLVDGYEPDAGFAEWFAASFIADIRRTDAPVVVIVAERPTTATTLSPFADEILALGPVDRAAIAQHFQLLGQRIGSPIEADELVHYVEAAHAMPEMLRSLTRVLQLAQQRDVAGDDVS